MKQTTRDASCIVGLCALVFSIVLGCATFTSYTQQMRESTMEFEGGQLTVAYKQVEKHYKDSLVSLLYHMEGGTILHCEPNLIESNRVFSRADAIIEKQQQQAIISLSATGAGVGSLVVNEKTIDYAGAPFERAMVPVFKAMNYLYQHDYEGARVEIRRSYAIQQKNRQISEKERDVSKNQAQGGAESQAGVLSQYADQRAVAAEIVNPYEDPFSYYLSAVVYELNGEYNDALVDLKNVVRLVRNPPPCVTTDLLRNARRTGLLDTLDLPKTQRQRPARMVDSKTEGEVLVVFQCGMAPRKREIKITVPVPKVGLVSMAFPKYEAVRTLYSSASIQDSAGGLLARTYVISNIDAMAYRALLDRMPILIVKQIARAAAKAAAAASAGQQGGDLAALGVSIFTTAMEQADLRSWLLLPKTIQVARFSLPQGRHDLFVAFEDCGGNVALKRQICVDVQPGMMRFISARSGTDRVIQLSVF